MSNDRKLWRLALIVAAVVLIDQVSKLLVSHLLTGPTPLIPLIDLRLAHNPGAAFSFLSNAGGWQRWFLIGLSVSISAVIAIWLTRIPATERITALALSLVLGGAIGNLIDRVVYGYVIDFIDFYYPSGTDCLPLFNLAFGGTCHWPTFNLADSAIFIGAALLLIASFKDHSKT